MTNINNQQHFIESFWDWTFLNDCFGETKIRVTDIDGLVERNGKFLLIETKMPSSPIPMGQSIMHKGLLKTGSFTIFIIWGKPNATEEMQVITTAKDHGIRKANNDTVKKMVKAWFDFANGRRA